MTRGDALSRFSIEMLLSSRSQAWYDCMELAVVRNTCGLRPNLEGTFGRWREKQVTRRASSPVVRRMTAAESAPLPSGDRLPMYERNDAILPLWPKCVEPWAVRPRYCTALGKSKIRFGQKTVGVCGTVVTQRQSEGG